MKTQDIGSGQVRSDDLAAGAVGSASLGPDVVGADQIADGAVGASQILDGAIDAAELAPHPAARVQRTTDLTVPDFGTAVVDFDTESGTPGSDSNFDNDNLHDNAVNPSRRTISTPGIYSIVAQARWENDPDGDVLQRFVRIRLTDGTDTSILGRNDSNELLEGSNGSDAQVSAIAPLQPGQFVEMQVFQNNNDDDPIDLDDAFAHFAIAWVGPA